MSKKFIVLDVEGLSTCRPYNIGYIICDNKNIYEKRSIAILPTIWENLQNCISCKEMTHKNIEEILSDVENKKYKYQSIDNVINNLLKDITEYKITEIWAYNCTFDKASLKRLFFDKWEILNNLVCFYDIIPAILHTKLLTKKYINFCKKNNYVTEKGNIMTKAEIVYRYLTNNNTFIEQHTGLEDCIIEYQILMMAKNTKKKIIKKSPPAWRVLKEFCEVNNITI